VSFIDAAVFNLLCAPDDKHFLPIMSVSKHLAFLVAYLLI